MHTNAQLNHSAAQYEYEQEMDSIALVLLSEAIIQPDTWWTKRSQKRYGRLKRKVVKVYPYAKAAGNVMQSVDAELQELCSNKDRRKFLKNAEEDLKIQFEGELKSLTMSEGVILIKLIDRETSDCSYELIQELKGNLSAFMWQSFARIFGQNLKSEYDPTGDDWPIEEIVRDIEYGYILVEAKPVIRNCSIQKEKAKEND